MIHSSTWNLHLSRKSFPEKWECGLTIPSAVRPLQNSLPPLVPLQVMKAVTPNNSNLRCCSLASSVDLTLLDLWSFSFWLCSCFHCTLPFPLLPQSFLFSPLLSSTLFLFSIFRVLSHHHRGSTTHYKRGTGLVLGVGSRFSALLVFCAFLTCIMLPSPIEMPLIL